ncbi:uncharacterized protein LOC103708367 [Phoenix dactylifera]|uniref:Uncharacterized protein LOC103708367 n=1 Tax=Phoenix dactylifera TaxID=42345 RepID=A0A8B7C4H5_PHODC|nr:uncharacterized protein LOC103708367 [Phoenix dactylifera]
MGSLETGVLQKRAPLLRSSPSAGVRSFFHRPRSRLARFLLFEKVDYLQWICTMAAFFFVVILFQAFLPGSVMEKSGGLGLNMGSGEGDGGVLERIDELDFGEGIRFVPSKLLERFEKERKEANLSLMALGRPVKQVGLLKPRLAMVVPDLSSDAMQLQMVSIAAALKEIGYDIEVFSFEEGPALAAWRAVRIHVYFLPISTKAEIAVDWLDYNGILVSSLEAKPVLSCLLQEPFKSIPIIWTIHERSLALRLSQYATNGQVQLINDWKQVLSRATVVVFPTYLLAMMYSGFDSGNYFVIPGSPAEAWGADRFFASHSDHDLRVNMGYESEDLLIAIIGSQFTYSGMWLEQALMLQALAPLLKEFPSENTSHSPLKVGILTGNSTSAYKMALETIALEVGYPRGIVEHVVFDEDMNSFLGIADLVIYGSFLEEQSFPKVLMQAMNLGKLVIAPDLGMIRRYVDDRVNGYLFPKENIGMLTEIVLQAVSNGKLSLSARKIASIGKVHARNLMASESIQGYAFLLENILKFSSEIASPKAAEEIPLRLKEEWQWHLFKNVADTKNLNRSFRSYILLDKLEEQWNHSQMESSANTTLMVDEAFSSIAWEEEKRIEMASFRRRLEEEELKDRSGQPHGTWEEVYRNVKRADRTRNELHERDDRELERTGQPLCIYEPYFGEGTWPFLHHTSLYRGIGLSSKGRRPGADDIDASSRLPLLSNVYYRDVLGEYGAFFALANRIDRIHKNAWIGFQSWRASARKACLSKKAETALVEAIEDKRHGDTLYFWVRMDKDPRNPLQVDFWTFCDAINAGNCRFAVSEALRRMYGAQHDLNALPQMPDDGDSWSVMYSWALPTRSFLEFVMFSRMFVDALDAQMYDEHHQSGHCYLSVSKDRHCYSRVLELLVNVWAYHSARRMVFVNPETGAMHEQHKLKNRRGHMWIRWFSYATLKSMDEDLAEESDSDHPDRRWLWPSTGEVFWQGMYERERNLRQQQKERRKQRSIDKIRRIRKRAHQKTLGKYIKPPREETGDLNTTRTL